MQTSDIHCSTLLGYKSVEELSKVREPFIEAFIVEKSREALVHAYIHAMEEKIGSCFEISLKKQKMTDRVIIM
ncbi:MAG: hypothetical protein OIN86_02240 [Candidatus Methanoperedens sp.]|nr:hypothetical protein [Candidatus Methanoperedens sp.]CAG1000555.1 hypothetical protein METP1_02854 [Methanosarcinales archaeon]